MTPRRLVVVPYFFPPFPGSGNRWLSMARHLQRRGHSVTVVATAAFGRLADDGERGVVRVGDLRSLRVVRRVLRRGELSTGGTALAVPPSALLTRVVVPDVQVLAWLPAALLVVRRLLSREAVDCLITSGPPDSNHLIGLLLGSRRPPWIADFRDGWCFEPLRQPFPTPAQRFLDAWLEHRVAREADIAVGATRPIAEDLERRLDAHAAYVPSGWDPEEAPQTLTSSERARADDTRRDGDKPVSLVYTGTFSGVRGSNPGPLLRALHLVRAIPGVPPVRLTLAGRLTNDERILIERSGVMDVVDHVGLLTRGAALALQRSADALVLLTSRSRSEATGKLFEYLGAGRPIIALAEGNEAERIVRETNTGVTVPPDDVDAIVRALRRVASGELEKEYAPRNLEGYTYPGPAEAMAELIETAIRLRAQS